MTTYDELLDDLIGDGISYMTAAIIAFEALESGEVTDE